MNRWLRYGVTVAAVAGLAATAGASAAVAAAPPAVGFRALSYGTYVSGADGAAVSGPTASSVIGCTNKGGLMDDDTAARVAVRAADFGAASSSTKTFSTTTSRGAGAQSRVTGVNILGGAVTADAVAAASTATVNASSQYAGTNQAVLTNLRVAGRAVSAKAAPNSSLKLTSAGRTYATVVVNAQSKRWDGSDWRVSTTGLTVRVTAANPMGVAVGTLVVVAPSTAVLTPPAAGYVGGYGYSTQAWLASGALSSSPTALAAASCTGGDTQANLAGVNLSGRVTTGTTRTTTTARVTGSGRLVAVKNTTSEPVVAGGLITARTVVADTAAYGAAGATAATLTDRSGFVGLRVRGLPSIGDSVKPNTVVDVPGLGRVTFHKVVRTGKVIQVSMIHIVLSQPVSGLPTGSTIIVGQSQSRLL